MRDVTAASPAIRVKDSRFWSQKPLSPPKPRSLIIDSAKSKPKRSALSVVCLLSSKLGLYCGEVVETIQPFLPIGMKTPISMRTPLADPSAKTRPVGPDYQQLRKVTLLKSRI